MSTADSVRLPPAHPNFSAPPETLRDHVVICNCNEKVRMIVAELQGSAEGKQPIVLLVQDEALWRENPAWHPRSADEVYVLFGGSTDDESLRQACIAEARAAVILADPRQGQLADPRSTLVAIAIERQNPQVHTVMELISSQNRIHVRSSEVNEIICLGEITEKLIAQSCISPGVKQVFEHLLSSSASTNQLFVAPLPEGMAPARFRDIARRIIVEASPFVLCGYQLAPRPEEEPPEPTPRSRLARPMAVDPFSERGLLNGAPHVFVINPRANVEPGKDTELRPGDKLVVLAFERPDLSFLRTPAAG